MVSSSITEGYLGHQIVDEFYEKEDIVKENSAAEQFNQLGEILSDSVPPAEDVKFRAFSGISMDNIAQPI